MPATSGNTARKRQLLTLTAMAEAVAAALDSRGGEARLCVWAAALLSYRRASCLKPAPPAYSSEGFTDYDALIKVFQKIPPLPSLLDSLKDLNYVNANRDIIDLLQHIMLDLNEPTLVAVPTSSMDDILSKVPLEVEASKPQYIFEVVYSSRSPMESKWSNLVAGRKTFFAYHGSRLENFHSILHHGLQQHMNKNNLYGSGTYLSSELSVSLPYSQTGLSWEGSMLGRYLSCVALCELIDYPTGIISQKSDSKVQNDGPNHSRTRANDSLAGEIPHKYYIVHNNDLIRVRYLLVYAKDMPPSSRRLNATNKKRGVLSRWLSEHKLFTLMIAYVVILIILGSNNNYLIYYYYKKVMKMFGLN